MHTPMPAGSVYAPGTLAPRTWPTAHIASVIPPDSTTVSRAEINSSIDGLTFSVGFEFLSGAGVDQERGLRFGFDGKDVSTSINMVGTADVPQSGGGAFYAGVPGLGDHEASVSYCDQAGEVYTYTWHFTVIE